jgi:hypothetical protein
MQVIKDSDWTEKAELIDAKDKGMIYDVNVHKKYNAENYWDSTNSNKRKERSSFVVCSTFAKY